MLTLLPNYNFFHALKDLFQFNWSLFIHLSILLRKNRNEREKSLLVSLSHDEIQSLLAPTDDKFLALHGNLKKVAYLQ